MSDVKNLTEHEIQIDSTTTREQLERMLSEALIIHKHSAIDIEAITYALYQRYGSR